MPAIPITTLYAVILAPLIIFLAWRVTVLRRSERVGLGDGGKRELARAIAAHGNAVENIPLALLMMLLLEANGASLLVHGFGAVLIIARAIHAWGMSRHSGASFGRFYGTLLSWLVILGLTVANAVRLV